MQTAVSTGGGGDEAAAPNGAGNRRIDRGTAHHADPSRGSPRPRLLIAACTCELAGSGGRMGSWTTSGFSRLSRTGPARSPE
jgi:hypothetical protein